MAVVDLKFTPRTDWITFEVLRHRLWQINDEQGRTIVNVSGSPVVSESNDFNVAIADAKGALVAVGPYVVTHVSALPLMVKSAFSTFGETGIEEGDMYLTNDPWLGAAHQNDVCVTAPIRWKGKLVAWTASVIHLIDVGGPVPGSWNPNATDTFQEAPRWRNLRIVRGGKVQPEVVDTFLTNSRIPKTLEIDMRAQIAAANVARERMLGILTRYGAETICNVMQDCLDYAEVLLRRKLREVPDGQWYTEDYLDHDGLEERLLATRLLLTKKGEDLTFDFRKSDNQAKGFINCTYAGLEGGVFNAVLPYLCNDIPWNSGVLRPLRILGREGALNHARFPAAVSSGVVNASRSVVNAASLGLAKMLSCSEKYRENLMAVWSGSVFIHNMSGKNQYGEPFATMLIYSPLVGAGARTFADGHDTSGGLGVPRHTVANVESLEALYPLFFFYRKRVTNSGGAGRFRGGVSAQSALTIYDSEGIRVNLNTVGTDHSMTAGVGGGYPGGGSNAILIKHSDVWKRLKEGFFPEKMADFNGETTMLHSKHSFDLMPGDVMVGIPHGGGGFGDPLQRDPERVKLDVIHGYVSLEQARKSYGVVLDPTSLEIRPEETTKLRKEMLQMRVEWRLSPPRVAPARSKTRLRPNEGERP